MFKHSWGTALPTASAGTHPAGAASTAGLWYCGGPHQHVGFPARPLTLCFSVTLGTVGTWPRPSLYSGLDGKDAGKEGKRTAPSICWT